MKGGLKLAVLLFVIILLVSCTKSEKKEEAKRDENKGQGESPQVVVSPPALPSFAGLVKRLKPAVVNISTTSVIHDTGFFSLPSPYGGEEDPFEEFFKRFLGDIPQREFRQKGLGSGFVISEDGYIITNNHVVEKAEDIQVVLEDGEKYKTKVVGTDPKTDLALLKIEPKRRLSKVTLGDSDKLQIGDRVIAIGNPFGLGHTVTAGIVSAKGRVLGFGDYDDYIQTDAPINPGNSGGPLFNLNGEVVGVTSAILARAQGIGFAIPINLARDIIEQLKGGGRVVRGWLGVQVQELTPEIAESMKLPDVKGALISDVSSGSPADKAGIKRGDIILEFNGHKIENTEELPRVVAMTRPGTEVRIKALRDGSEKDFSVKLGALPSKGSNTEEGQISEGKLGLTVEKLTPEIAGRLGIEEGGVIVTKVDSGSLADESGFQSGDVILEINRKKITTPEDYKSTASSLKKGQTALFLIRRGEVTLYIAMKL
ncbi:MAG: peptidase [Candidatus Dadabacteria bacterium]